MEFLTGGSVSVGVPLPASWVLTVFGILALAAAGIGGGVYLLRALRHMLRWFRGEQVQWRLRGVGTRVDELRNEVAKLADAIGPVTNGFSTMVKEKLATVESLATTVHDRQQSHQAETEHRFAALSEQITRGQTETAKVAGTAAYHAARAEQKVDEMRTQLLGHLQEAQLRAETLQAVIHELGMDLDLPRAPELPPRA